MIGLLFNNSSFEPLLLHCVFVTLWLLVFFVSFFVSNLLLFYSSSILFLSIALIRRVNYEAGDLLIFFTFFCTSSKRCDTDNRPFPHCATKLDLAWPQHRLSRCLPTDTMMCKRRESGGHLDNPSQSSCRGQPARREWCNGSGHQETWNPGRIFPPWRILRRPHPCRWRFHPSIQLCWWLPSAAPELHC